MASKEEVLVEWRKIRSYMVPTVGVQFLLSEEKARQLFEMLTEEGIPLTFSTKGFMVPSAFVSLCEGVPGVRVFRKGDKKEEPRGRRYLPTAEEASRILGERAKQFG